MSPDDGEEVLRLRIAPAATQQLESEREADKALLDTITETIGAVDGCDTVRVEDRAESACGKYYELTLSGIRGKSGAQTRAIERRWRKAEVVSRDSLYFPGEAEWLMRVPRSLSRERTATPCFRLTMALSLGLLLVSLLVIFVAQRGMANPWSTLATAADRVVTPMRDRVDVAVAPYVAATPKSA